MPPVLIGSHCSIAGGLHLAIEEATRLGLDCVQVFTKNQRRWASTPLHRDEIKAWTQAITAVGWDRSRVVSHNSYLVNLATPDACARARSIALQRDETERCEALGIAACVIHPGAHLGAQRKPREPNRLGEPPSTDELDGLRRIAASLDELHRQLKGFRTITLLETTVGSGTNLGYDFGHLRMIRELVRAPERVGFCIDTCHIVAAGHDCSTPSRAKAVLERFDAECGLDQVHAVHVNDSVGACGSRVDRHEHIGHGACGASCFRAVLKHPKLRGRPMILETAKEAGPADEPWDIVNARELRRLAGVRAKR
ncbi:MAG: deoxyribonuclease IV [Phycisphaerae bacterium]|nr:deoxyribonuclease IV [Phycisphaerae bacterium]